MSPQEEMIYEKLQRKSYENYKVKNKKAEIINLLMRVEKLEAKVDHLEFENEILKTYREMYTEILRNHTKQLRKLTMEEL